MHELLSKTMMLFQCLTYRKRLSASQHTTVHQVPAIVCSRWREHSVLHDRLPSLIIIIIIRIYYGAAQPVLSSALQYNNVIVDSGN